MVFPAMGREVVRIMEPHLRGTALSGFTAFQDIECRLRDAGAVLPKKDVRDFLRPVAGRKAPPAIAGLSYFFVCRAHRMGCFRVKGIINNNYFWILS